MSGTARKDHDWHGTAVSGGSRSRAVEEGASVLLCPSIYRIAMRVFVVLAWAGQPAVASGAADSLRP